MVDIVKTARPGAVDEQMALFTKIKSDSRNIEYGIHAGNDGQSICADGPGKYFLRPDATRSVESKNRICAAMNVMRYHTIVYDTEEIMDMQFSHVCGCSKTPTVKPYLTLIS